jgi:iron complex transport system permease protein
MRRPLLTTTLVVVGLVASFFLAVALGAERVPFRNVIDVLASALTDAALRSTSEVDYRIVWLLRVPRALTAVVIGGGLAVIGVAMQTLVRNPLAEPYILGISSGASAGLSLFFLGVLPPILGTALTGSLAGFAGGIVSITIVYLVARTGRTVSVSRLLLAGIAMSSLMGAISSFITFASPDPGKLRAVLFLLLGSLHGASWVGLAAPTIAALGALVALTLLARPLDALLLGEEPAASLGVSVEAVKRLLILLAALVTGTLVAAAGPIGFVGLIVPHAVRSFTGVTHRRLLPLSFAAGGTFLLWSDLAARVVLPSQDLPVGIVTALCGVPFFLYLLRRQRYVFGS